MGYGTQPLTNHSKFYGLLHELGDRVRDNQRDHTKRVREQLTLIMASCGPDDPPKPLRDAIEKVFSISGEWERGVVVSRDDRQAKKQIQEAVDDAIMIFRKIRARIREKKAKRKAGMKAAMTMTKSQRRSAASRAVAMKMRDWNRANKPGTSPPDTDAPGTRFDVNDYGSGPTYIRDIGVIEKRKK
jgi:MoxR-like ATPase